MTEIIKKQLQKKYEILQKDINDFKDFLEIANSYLKRV